MADASEGAAPGSGRVEFKTGFLRAWTSGLPEVGQQDLRVQVASDDLVEPSVILLRVISAYIKTQERRITTGETFQYGSWNLKFEAGADGYLDAYNLDLATGEFVLGATQAIGCWEAQQSICDMGNAEFEPARLGDYVAVTIGVMEGDAAIAVRYPPDREGMTGWFFLSSSWNGAPDSVRIEHLYTVIQKLPDALQYMALPPGYRVDLTTKQYGFDPAVLGEEPAEEDNDGGVGSPLPLGEG